MLLLHVSDDAIILPLLVVLRIQFLSFEGAESPMITPLFQYQAATDYEACWIQQLEDK